MLKVFKTICGAVAVYVEFKLVKGYIAHLMTKEMYKRGVDDLHVNGMELVELIKNDIF